MKKQPDNSPFSLSVEELALRLECSFEGNGKVRITGAGSLEKAKQGQLVFLSQHKFRPLLEQTKASAVILPPEEQFSRLPVIRSDNPHLAFVRALKIFFPLPRPSPGIHPSASVAASARLGRDVSIGALAYVGERVEIGDGSTVFPLAGIYPDVKIGRSCVIHSQVSLREGTEVGNGVILHNGAVIGADGFGYLRNEDGSSSKIPQVGTVRIEDNVEIGANSTIDRAALDKTVIGAGTKIDNLVHLAHNVEVGRDGIIVAQAGISGSVKIGKKVIIAGQAGVVDHVHIGDGVLVAPQSGVRKDIPAGSHVMGSPSMDFKQYGRMTASLKQIPELKKKIEELEKKIAALEKS